MLLKHMQLFILTIYPKIYIPLQNSEPEPPHRLFHVTERSTDHNLIPLSCSLPRQSFHVCVSVQADGL